MPVCYLALGGNTGDVASTFQQALKRLPELGVDILSCSRLYRTAPVGADAGDPFLNAAAEAVTTLEAPAVLDVLQQVETELGRERTTHWGPRTIDLDLILYGYEVIHSPRLTVPHPAAWYRRFVIDPLHEIAPQAFHPVQRKRIELIRRGLLTRPLSIALLSESSEDVAVVERALTAAHDERIRITTPDRAVLVLKLAEVVDVADDPRTVAIGHLPTATRHAMDILTAALDEPQPLAR